MEKPKSKIKKLKTEKPKINKNSLLGPPGDPMVTFLTQKTSETQNIHKQAQLCLRSALRFHLGLRIQVGGLCL